MIGRQVQNHLNIIFDVPKFVQRKIEEVIIWTPCDTHFLCHSLGNYFVQINFTKTVLCSLHNSELWSQNSIYIHCFKLHLAYFIFQFVNFSSSVNDAINLLQPLVSLFIKALLLNASLVLLFITVNYLYYSKISFKLPLYLFDAAIALNLAHEVEKVSSFHLFSIFNNCLISILVQLLMLRPSPICSDCRSMRSSVMSRIDLRRKEIREEI